MSRRDFLALVGGGLLAVVLSGCTSFSPVYGGAGANLASARFNFAPPTNRLEQIILNHLAVSFPHQGGPGDPVLKVSATSSSPSGALTSTFAVGNPANVRVEATITIVQNEEKLFSATRFTDTAYQDGRLTLANRAVAEDTREVAAKSTAEALRAAILAGYRPGAVSTQPR